MFETEGVGMEHLTRRGEIRLGAKSNVLPTAVGAIASERKTEVLKVHANRIPWCAKDQPVSGTG